MPEDFMAFAGKLARAFTLCFNWLFIFLPNFLSQGSDTSPTGAPHIKQMFSYWMQYPPNFLDKRVTKFHKGFWYKSGIKIYQGREPADIHTPCLYMRKLQMDHAQSLSKQMEFEIALARVSSTDFLDNVRVTPSPL